MNMTTITVSRIISEEGLITLKDKVKNWENIEVLEVETGATWVNFGGFNGHPKDLWLKKKGTLGATSKTFIRISVASYRDLSDELRFRKLPSSSLLYELVEKEAQETQSKAEAGLAIIAAFSDAEKAEKYLAKRAEKNSHQYRTYLGNKCLKMGALRNQAFDLEKRCREIVSK